MCEQLPGHRHRHIRRIEHHKPGRPPAGRPAKRNSLLRPIKRRRNVDRASIPGLIPALIHRQSLRPPLIPGKKVVVLVNLPERRDEPHKPLVRIRNRRHREHISRGLHLALEPVVIPQNRKEPLAPHPPAPDHELPGVHHCPLPVGQELRILGQYRRLAARKRQIM